LNLPTMKTKLLFTAAALLSASLLECVAQTAMPHRFDGITSLPDHTVSLSGIAAREDQTLGTARNASTRCAQGELLVKWKEGPDSPAATLGNAQIGSTVQRNFHEIGWQQVKLPCGLSVQEAITRYRALGSVSAVEPNYAVAPILPPRRDATDPLAGVGSTGVPPSVEDRPPGSTEQLPTPRSALRTEQSAASAPTPIIPNDPKFSAQWDLKKIGMPNAWAITTGSSNVVVAIIDTGVDYNHEDLAANMWRNPGETGLDANGNDKATNGIDDDGDGYVDDVYGIDTVDHDSDPMDLGYTLLGNPEPNYHGTHCAGIIGAVGNNGKGVAGINWSVQIMALRVSGGDESIGNSHAFVGDVVEAFNYLIQQRRRGVNIRVTSNSYSGYASQASTLAVRDAINIAGTEGILTVCSAGNDGISTDSFSNAPSAFDSPYVISVAASDSNDGMPSKPGCSSGSVGESRTSSGNAQ
jgi:subtilisin family serine protease